MKEKILMTLMGSHTYVLRKKERMGEVEVPEHPVS